MADRKQSRHTHSVDPEETIPLWKKGLFALAATVMAFALLELLLLILGTQPSIYEEDPYVGFSSYSPLFIQEGEGRQAVMVTAPNKLTFFNSQQFSQHKAPDTYRIFCLGGSTVYGRPYGDPTSFCGWLRTMLRDAQPDRNWEVINAGGISYASYRVAKLMEELIQYEPDLFIVYSAHNEFLERRTYGEIIDQSPWIRDLNAFLSHSRTYSVMKRVLAPADPQPSPQEANTPILPAEVDALLDRSIGPEDYTRDDLLKAQVLEHYAFNLERMADIARAASADIIFIAPASNLRSMSPFKSEHAESVTPEALEQWRSLIEQARQSYDSGQYDLALNKVNAAVQLSPRHADTRYLAGEIALAAGDFQRADQAFIRAKDEDVCPLRALSSMTDIVHKTAAETEAGLIDFDPIARNLAPNGIPGDQVFLDHVHPRIDAHGHLAQAILEKLASGGIVQLDPSWSQTGLARVTHAIESRINRAEQGNALRNLSRVLLWAGKFKEARAIAENAVELSPENPGAHYQLAMATERLGNLEAAIGHYQNALERLPTYVEAHYSLGAAMLRTGDLLAAQRHLERALELEPDHLEAAFNLALTHLQHGRLEESESLLRDVIERRPDYVKARIALARNIREQGKPDDAATILAHILDEQPDNAEALNQKGLVLAESGDFQEAVEAFTQAIQRDPRFAEAYNNLGNVFLQQQRPEEAAIRFGQALNLDSSYTRARYNLGVSLARLEDIAGAVEAYQHVLRLQPDHAQALNNLGILMAGQGQLEPALQYFQAAVDAHPDYREARHNLELTQRMISQTPDSNR